MMGRSPAASSREEEMNGLKKGPWTAEEDRALVEYIRRHGHGSWRALPKLAGLNRCGKSCRLRWTNYLRPDIKRGKFSEQEEQIIIDLHRVLGNKWSAIAGHLPGRTDNEIKNFWNTNLRKKLLKMGIDPVTHRPRSDYPDDLFSYLQQLLTAANILNGLTLTTTNTNTTQWGDINNNNNNNNNNATQQQLAKLHLLHNMLQILGGSNNNNNNNNSLLGPIPSLPNYESLLGLNNNVYPNVFNFPSPTTQNQTSLFQNFDSPQFSAANSSMQILDAIAPTNSDPTASPPPFSNNNSLPNLVSASSPPECSNTNNNNNNNNKTKKMEIIINNNDEVMTNNHNDECSDNPPSSSTNFEMWASSFMYEEANDVYWKDLIDQEENQA